VRKVVLAVTRDGIAAIAQGLQAGETVVTDGQLRLTPGSKVKVKDKVKDKAKQPAQKPAAPK